MKVGVKVEGADKLLAGLQAKLAQVGKPTPRAAVIYDAPYAVSVHENVNAFHPAGQAKFLETPARERRADMAQKVEDGLKAGKTLEQANLDAARLLLEASLPLVPVQTGRLKASGRVEAQP